MFSISATFANIKLRSFFLWMLLGAFVVIVPLYLFSNDGSVSDSIFTVCTDSLVFFAFPILWLSYKMKHQNLQFRSFLDRPMKWDWKLIILATVMGMLFSYGISTIEFYILSYVTPNYIINILNTDQTIDNYNLFTTIFSIVSACVFAPIMEELIFRGFFLNRLSYKWGIRKAVLISSIMFGLGHSDVLGATLFGITMCLIYIKTRSLLVGMVVHSLNNLTVSMIQLMGPADVNHAQIQLSDLQSIPDLIYSVIAVIISLVWFIPFIWKGWNRAVEEGLPLLKRIHPVRDEEEDVIRKVRIAEDAMAVDLPDEIVNKLHLEEDDYVKLEMDGEKLIITKSNQSHSMIL
ncbi:type II CAAX prenyl endopeptidase Rce1 family protein [Ectobacillus sp. sgz5001026]|uniref:CPBP family glutamic-type intramembrane protease n=1 Tax=Ectobacillus sp. sgz5001026 TaxID=3242473 RepID=UPI0036D21B5A